MNGVSYQTLRLAAENATPGEWCTDDYGVIADAGLNANYYIASCSGPDNRANKRFIAAANPATVLALLDELERNQQYIKRRDQENEDIALTVGKLRVDLEAAEKHIAELDAIKSAAEKLVRCKGRYHSEQNYRALAALFGVTVPDLPPQEVRQ
ncbi:ead/Ea22-like family protein [Escherichia coli O4]|nr:ead/Ea22-like family protein [Escherichia coli]EKK2313696.1 ead/Ea22-like family protein [Escherichia coli O4]EFB6518805.1 ead/Ea22-like family protein [Escherichia coli]EKD3064447.1 ead/Ea22-like family protein [Escherichia coli]EKF0532231.1 ead/Ea22-like family protein [Escherichia coli]